MNLRPAILIIVLCVIFYYTFPYNLALFMKGIESRLFCLLFPFTGLFIFSIVFKIIHSKRVFVFLFPKPTEEAFLKQN